MTAKDVTERKEAVLTFRVNLKSKQGHVQKTARYSVLMFPSTEGSPKQGDADPVDPARDHAERLAKRASERFDEVLRRKTWYKMLALVALQRRTHQAGESPS